jgi:hypothetical protein
MSDVQPTDESGPVEQELAQVDRTGHGAPSADALEGLIVRLERAAEQLRSGDLSTDAAATLVEECAVLANRAGTELERRMHTPPPGQGSLL